MGDKVRKKVFLICSGLGHINRGYESFARECFDNLLNESSFEIYLLKGAGNSFHREITIPCFKRNSKFANLIASLFGKDGYYIEQLSFFFMIIPRLIINRPSVIFISDFLLMCWIRHFQKIFKLKYKVLFSNGGAYGPPFVVADQVQQLLNYHLDIALSGGENPIKHTLLPYGVNSNKVLISIDESTKIELRNKYGIPEGKKILVSVGALNCFHKRMDYLINEFSILNEESLFLLMVGQQTEETNKIIDLAEKKLQRSCFKIISVNSDKMNEIYRIADYFVLASLSEGLPRVLLEALNYGLPIFVHKYKIAEEVLGGYGYYADFTKEGTLAKLINQNLYFVAQEDLKFDRHQFLYENYSWDILKSKYINLINKTIGSL